jgi:hypothetical protein
VQDQSANPFVSNIDQENQAMNHSDLKTIEFAAYIGLDWADRRFIRRIEIGILVPERKQTYQPEIPAFSA